MCILYGYGMEWQRQNRHIITHTCIYIHVSNIPLITKSLYGYKCDMCLGFAYVDFIEILKDSCQTGTEKYYYFYLQFFRAKFFSNTQLFKALTLSVCQFAVVKLVFFDFIEIQRKIEGTVDDLSLCPVPF